MEIADVIKLLEYGVRFQRYDSKIHVSLGGCGCCSTELDPDFSTPEEALQAVVALLKEQAPKSG